MEEKYRLTPETIKDIQEASSFYEERSPKIADQFVSEVFEKFDKISENPKLYPIHFNNIRKTSLNKFPFNIFYRIIEPIILIISVWHQKRDERWKNRILNSNDEIESDNGTVDK